MIPKRPQLEISVEYRFIKNRVLPNPILSKIDLSFYLPKKPVFVHNYFKFSTRIMISAKTIADTNDTDIAIYFSSATQYIPKKDKFIVRIVEPNSPAIQTPFIQNGLEDISTNGRPLVIETLKVKAIRDGKMLPYMVTTI